MKSITCECGHEEVGATDNDVMSKLQSHIHNEHPERASDMKKLMKKAEKTIKNAVATM